MEGDKEAWNEFFEIYHHHAIKLAKIALNFYPQYKVPFDEYYTVAIEQIIIVLSYYETGSNTFYQYWKSSAFKAFSKYNIEFSPLGVSMKLNSSISLDDYVYDTDIITYSDILGIEDDFVKDYEQDRFEIMLSRIIPRLTEDQKRALFLFMQGLSRNEILAKMNWTLRQYYRAKNKIKELMEFEFNNINSK
jgi:hypothetical protein